MKIADILEPQLRVEAEKRKLSVLKRGNARPVSEIFGNGSSKRERSTAGQLATYLGESDRQFEMKRSVWKHVANTPAEERKKIIASIRIACESLNTELIVQTSNMTSAQTRTILNLVLPKPDSPRSCLWSSKLGVHSRAKVLVAWCLQRPSFRSCHDSNLGAESLRTKKGN